MATYTVTRVRKELSADGTHEHIEGVCTNAGIHYTRQEVVDSIKAGNTWKRSADGYEATITTMSYCPKPNCLAKPYIKTNPDSTKKDNLENLDRCLNRSIRSQMSRARPVARRRRLDERPLLHSRLVA